MAIMPIMVAIRSPGKCLDLFKIVFSTCVLKHPYYMESWGEIPLNLIKQFHKVLSKCLYLRKCGFSPAMYTFGLVVFKCLTSSYDG